MADGERKVVTREEAYAALEAAIAAFNAYDGQEHGYVTVDAVLIVGAQKIDDDGDRVGSVGYYPRHGCQPSYVTGGLIDAAKAYVQRNMLGDE